MKPSDGAQFGVGGPAGRPRFALWDLGFRPFYLLASSFAAVSIGLWTLQISGWWDHAYLRGPIWHAHEMLFGFILAVVVGFLFTAGRNWTNRPTPTGAPLAGLALLWVVGRVLVLTPLAWPAAIINAAFPLAAAIALGIPFHAARNRRNYFLVGVMLLMSALELGVHLAQLGVLQIPGWLSIQLALDLMLFVVSVMGGRVIPMFTNSGVAGANARRTPVLERLTLASVLLLLLLDLWRPAGPLLAASVLAGALLHLTRWWLWQPWKSRATPIVWILHVAYLWIPLHLVLRALAQAGWASASAATHALTAGVTGCMIIGMMTRTARGHTGRPLRADRADVSCYLLILLAALVRVFGPLLAPAHVLSATLAAGILWSAGFGLYALRYWPVLTRARVDGGAG